MIQFKVYRAHLNTGYTIGHLSYKLDSSDQWQFFCDTLEDVVRPDGQKVYGETAIPYGQYKFILSYSPKMQKVLPEILDVPNFTNIRIHVGNTKLDTFGCILLGENKEKGKVINSTNTVAKFMQLLKDNEQSEYNILIC